MTAYLSRVSLRRDAPVAALAPVLLPSDPSARAGVAHRLLWALFADAPDRTRDFLWREMGGGGLVPGRSGFMVLSSRKPVDAHGLFEVESREFAPALARGDRLGFSLRANPVVTRRNPATGKAGRHDVVMDRLRAVPRHERAEARLRHAEGAGRDWLAAQGERSGFRVAAGSLRVDGYEQLRIEHDRERGLVRISVLEMEGILEVVDPEAFVPALGRGFGKAKAFGCGLMLVRRAP
jgi:CRISPR system Cascade subunit CasE